MTSSTTSRARRRWSPGSLALAALAFAAFVVGTAELVVVGILDLLAEDTGVSVSTAGQLVTAYALGIAFGAPVISALTQRFGRRAVLRAAIAAFLVGNLVAVVATSFGMLLVVRVLTGALHGLIAGVATGIAASLVAPERRGQAISLVVGGITVATVVGVPAGTLVGQVLGWQAAIVAIIALGTLALAGTLRLVPPVPSLAGGGLGAQTRAAFAPRVLAMLAIAVLLFGSQFIAFTYLTPFLDEVTGISGGLVSVFLLAFGLAATAGTLLGGRAADRDAQTTLLAAATALVVAMGALYVVGSSALLVVVALAVWGLAGFAIPPALLLRTITLAGAGRDQAVTLGISAFNAGIAAGSLLGGEIIATNGARSTVLVATVAGAVALPAIWLTRSLGETGRPAVAQTAQCACA
jgi:MFS transporter, DHA1 family, inner membrane transport protein